MSQIDWNNAPEWAGAVIESPCGREYFVEAWGGCSKRQLVGAPKLDDLKADMSGEDHSWTLVETRPVAWNGESLPPVGLCELRLISAGGDWHEADIKFASRNVVVWDWVGEPSINGLCTAYVHAVQFRPVRTPEQIAAEERERRIAELAKVIRVSGWDSPEILAAYLDSHDYRKQVAP